MAFTFYEFENNLASPPIGFGLSNRMFTTNGLLGFRPNIGGDTWVRLFGGTLTSNQQYNFPNKSGTIALTTDIGTPISLTTIGSSGAATLINSVLNIPVYGGGTVSSVGLLDGSTNPIYAITGSPVTTSGTLTFSLLSQTQNTFLAAPNGSSGQPSFRAIVAADLPSLSYWGLAGNSGTVDGTNFLGTIDNIPFTIRTNNQVSLRIDPLLNNYFNGILAGNPSATGANNNAIGYTALGFLTTGYGNVANGYGALSSVSTGYYNVGIGYNALRNMTNYNNIGIGYVAGQTITTGYNNVLIGYNSDVSGGTITNSVAIGANSVVSLNNMVVLGANSVTQFGFNGALMPYYSSAYNAGTSGQVLTSQGAGVAPQWVSGVSPTGSAGGDLTGTYPNPTIGANKVTYAKMQQASASTLLGNPTGSLANISEITLGSGLSFSGSTLVATASSYSAGTGITLTGTTFSLTSPVTVALGGTGTTTAFTAGNVVIAGTSGVYTQDSNFAWDTTNHTLNIGGAASASGIPLNIASSNNGSTYFQFKNTSSGGSALTGIDIINNSSALLKLQITGSGFTPSGAGVASQAILYCNPTAGLNITAPLIKMYYQNVLNTQTFAMGASGNIAIGAVAIASTSAWLLLSAGTTTVAPLRLTSGTNMTSAVGGAVEFDGTNIFGTFNTTVGRWAFAMNSVQYATPSTGATVVATAQIAQLVCNPAGSLLALTVTFPANPVNGQQFDLAISQIITTLTLQTSDSSTINGTIITSAINSFGGWVYVASVTTWFKNR